MKENLRLVTLTVTVGALGGVAVLTAAFQAERRERTAFTAKIEARSYDPDGDLTATTLSAAAFRGDGASVDLREAVDGSPVNNRVILDPDAGVRTAVDSFTKSITTYPLHPARKRALQMKPSASCESTLPGEMLESPRAVSENMLGRRVLRAVTRETLNFGGGRSEVVQRELLLAPELDCFPLRTVVTVSRSDGTRLGSTITEVTSVTLGEPDPLLFEIPEDYVERAPSAVFAERARLEGRDCQNCGETANALDQAYYSGIQAARSEPAP